MASCLVLAPAEVIKQNAQMLRSNTASSSSGENRGRSEYSRGSTSLQALRQLGGAGAGRRLFTGYTALVARNLPFTALQFPMFEHLKAKLWERYGGEPKDERDKDLWRTGKICAASAGSAGAIAAFVTTPSDVVKTRMMLSAGESTSPSPSNMQINHEKPRGVTKEKPTRKNSAWTVTKQVYSERGVKGFFRGGLFRSAWTMLGSGLYLGTYETAKVWLKRRKPEIKDAAGL